ncbi:hypothetical protein DTO164E3_5181 [Paecilomyces variotii]|nr:hypothetical protein DTO164E3_5181 [Paecilomyces variotii]KAJ9360827.1 hypothetical protein DTO027B9_1221 [Paecilomyces variotii]
MDPPRQPQHQPFSRPSLFAGPPDLRAGALPPRPYAPPSVSNGRSQPAYDPLGRRENELVRPAVTYGPPTHTYAHEKPMSPVPFASLRNNGPNGFHSPGSGHASIGKHHDGTMREHNGLRFRDELRESRRWVQPPRISTAGASSGGAASGTCQSADDRVMGLDALDRKHSPCSALNPRLCPCHRHCAPATVSAVAPIDWPSRER